MDDLFPINKELYTKDELKILDKWFDSQNKDISKEIPDNIKKLLSRDSIFKFFDSSLDFETNSEYLAYDRSLNVMKENLNIYKRLWSAKAAELINSDPEFKNELRNTDYELYKKYFPNEA